MADVSAVADPNTGVAVYDTTAYQWCTARTGWDGPTGLGTPNGTGGF
ncbi:hypothetical protein [Rugosimonospora africana]|uniref:Uncharacterized protein n=1 Tax=Rugosimonospora africana TaxID=556532 RepID=A0A8J3VS46_9ACTN|nr:hypothetical protein [Rugosimonospora africana]GIH16872.1 hypothetical protein Raf01_50440 [Rugosimonospora africana]